MATQVYARLTPEFREKAQKSGLTTQGLADAIGVSRQFYSAVWHGKEPVTGRFMFGAVRAGLGETFSDIAEPALPKETAEKAVA